MAGYKAAYKRLFQSSPGFEAGRYVIMTGTAVGEGVVPILARF